MRVIEFTGQTVGKVECGDVLKGALEADLREVVIIGITADGSNYRASSERDERTLWLIELFKNFIVNNASYRGE